MDYFWFEKSFFGDVIGVYDDTGTKLVSYTYDAWGICRSTAYNTQANATLRQIASHNPFRYRGYYLDSDTGYYRLGDRLHDPALGRFLCPDKYVSTGQGILGYNMYAYCGNNPVMRVDCSGECWHIIAGAAAGGAIGAVSSILSQLATEREINWRLVGISALSGILSGALASTGVGVVIQISGQAAISGVESFVSQGIKDGFDNIDYGSVAFDALIGGVTSINSGLSKGEAKHLMKQGINTVKNFRGFAKTAKYYFSQTYTMFYKPLKDDSIRDGIKEVFITIATYYLEQWISG